MITIETRYRSNKGEWSAWEVHPDIDEDAWFYPTLTLFASPAKVRLKLKSGYTREWRVKR